jgi:creatinine amidohydrolase
MKQPYRYSHLSWPEIKKIDKDNVVVLQPMGAVEDHGHHLPVDTDNILVMEICMAVARSVPDDVLVMPLVPYGYVEHHMDFPGPISIEDEILLGYLSNAARSLIRHGFRKILYVNGHGSNRPFMDIAARKAMDKTESIVGAITPYALARAEISEICESEYISHAAEMETSLMLYLDESLVDMPKAARDINFPITKYHWRDFLRPAPLAFMDQWSRISKTGVVGDATVASKEKGEKIFAVVVEKMVELVKEFKEREIKPVVDHH